MAYAKDPIFAPGGVILEENIRQDCGVVLRLSQPENPGKKREERGFIGIERDEGKKAKLTNFAKNKARATRFRAFFVTPSTIHSSQDMRSGHCASFVASLSAPVTRTGQHKQTFDFADSSSARIAASSSLFSSSTDMHG